VDTGTDSTEPVDSAPVSGGLLLEVGEAQPCAAPVPATWEKTTTLQGNGNAGPDGGAVAVEDLDGDGDLDIISSWDVGDWLVVWWNDGGTYTYELIADTEAWQLSRVDGGWVSGGQSPVIYDESLTPIGQLPPVYGAVREVVDVQGVGRLVTITSPFGPEHQWDYVVDGAELDQELASQNAFDALVFDHDQDGDEDVYVVNDNPFDGRNVMWHQQDGVLVPTDYAPIRMAGMGGDVGDLNGDGLPDLYLTAAARNILLLQNPDHTFIDVTFGWNAGVLASGKAMAWGGVFWDADNDGDLDLMVAEGDFGGEYNLDLGPQPLSLQRNSDETFSPEVWDEGSFRGLVPVDLNDDGVLDIVVSSASDGPAIWLSQGCGDHGWLRFDGPEGATIRVLGESPQTHWISRDSGFGASKPARSHVGLGDATEVLIRVEYQGLWAEQALSPNRVVKVSVDPEH